MVKNIISYELKSNLPSKKTFILFLILLFQGIWYAKGFYDMYPNVGVYMNSSAIFYKSFAGVGMFLVIIIGVFSGNFLFREIENDSALWYYALPISKKAFFIGRFISAYIYNLVISLGLIAGMLLLPLSGIGKEFQFGTTPLLQIFHGFLIFALPNILLLTALVFASITYARKVSAGYLAVAIITILFMIAKTTMESSDMNWILALLDPFGTNIVEYINQGMTTIEKNTAFLPLDIYLIENRFFWLCITFLLLKISYRKFSFHWFLSRKDTQKKRKKKVSFSCETNENQFSPIYLSIEKSLKWHLKSVFNLSKTEYLMTIRSLGVRIVLGAILILILLENLLWNESYYIGATMPITSIMTYFRFVFGVFIMIILMVMAIELFFREQTCGMGLITDSLPTPQWVIQSSRLFTMFGVAFTFSLSFFIISVFTQLMKGGGSYFDFSRYVNDIWGYHWGWITFILWIAYAFFIGTLTRKRFLSHIICICSFLAMILIFDQGIIEETRFAYSIVPGFKSYSELYGYGIWESAGHWYILMWLCLGSIFILLGISLRNAGMLNAIKLGTVIKQNPKLVVSMTCFMILFFITHLYIYKEVNTFGNFESTSQASMRKADYEKKYISLDNKPQLHYQHIDLNIDFFQSERRVEYSAELFLINNNITPIDTICLCFPRFCHVESLEKDHLPLKVLSKDSFHNQYTYLLPNSIQQGKSIILSLKANKQYKGFTQDDDPQLDLAFQGLWGNVKDYLPTIGFNMKNRLEKNRERKEYGLSLLKSRKASITDEFHLTKDTYMPDAEFVSGIIHATTDKGQRLILPGKTLCEYEKDNRYRIVSKIDIPCPFDWYFASAMYDSNTKREKGMEIKIYFAHNHPFNVDFYHTSLVSCIDYARCLFGSFPYKEIKLIEIPFFKEPLYVYGNTIAISEKEGWYADISHPKERLYVLQTIASSVFKQWIQTHIRIADVQGADMLQTAIPEALGMIFIQNEEGKNAIKLLIAKKMNSYIKHRNNEPNIEPPLLYADGADYLAQNKGAIVIYEMIQEIGIQNFVSILQKIANKSRQRRVSFYDFYEEIKPMISNQIRCNILPVKK